MERRSPYQWPRAAGKSFLTAAIALAAVVFLLVGCGGKSSDEATGAEAGGEDAPAAAKTYDGPNVSLQFWNGFTGGDGPFMRDLVKQFNSEHPNINVKMVVHEWASYYQKVPQAVQSNRGPDVGIMHADQLATNAARRVIVPLDDLAKTLELDESDFSERLWTAGIYEDTRYGIPLDTHPLGFYYNKDHLQKAGIDKPPTNREEMDAALKKLKQSGVEHPFWQSSTWPAHLMFMSLLPQFGGSLYNEDATEATFNSPEGVEALTWMVNLVKNGYSPKNVSQDADDVAFRNGKSTFHWDGIWRSQDYGKTNPDLNWGVAPIPQIGEQKGVWANSHQMVITRQASQDENKLQAAKVFINWISEKSIEWAKAGQVPARNSVRESAEFKALEHQPIFAQQLDYVTMPPAVPGIGDAQLEMEQAVNRAVLGKQSPKQALDQGAQRANQLLEQNRQKYGTEAR
ncbi:MAG: ABC transporter substrate-binding protein [Actinomycetota bacterium]|nr:ABC transporter substrate-binding protein [Actinomycetota bacterium]